MSELMTYEEWYALNEQDLYIEAAETGADREYDYDSEDYAEEAYDVYCNRWFNSVDSDYEDHTKWSCCEATAHLEAEFEHDYSTPQFIEPDQSDEVFCMEDELVNHQLCACDPCVFDTDIPF